MKRLAYLAPVLLILVALAFAGRARDARPPLPTHRPNLDIKLCAHRGVKMYAPENTLPAIQKAIDMGYSYVELDVRFSRDGVPMLMHNDWITQMTLMPGPPSAYPWSVLKNIHVGWWRGLEFRDTRIPSVEEALKLMEGKVKLYLDPKEMPNAEVIRLLKEHHFYPDNLVVVGDDARTKKYAELLGAEGPVMPSCDRVEDLPGRLAEFPSMVAINTHCEYLTPELIDAAHAAGLLVFTNVINQSRLYEEPCMRKPIEYGSDVIQLDNPETFFKLLAEYKARTR